MDGKYRRQQIEKFPVKTQQGHWGGHPEENKNVLEKAVSKG